MLGVTDIASPSTLSSNQLAGAPGVKRATGSRLRAGVTQRRQLRYVLTKTVGGTAEDLPNVRPSWRREFLSLQTWRAKDDHISKTLDSLLMFLLQDFGYRGSIGLYMTGSRRGALALSPRALGRIATTQLKQAQGWASSTYPTDCERLVTGIALWRGIVAGRAALIR